jgi:DNA polymerase-1
VRTLLLDGDTLIFEAAASSEHEVQWESWLWTLHADLDRAIEKFDASVEEIKEGLRGDRVILALSDDARWRNAVMPEYKAHRHKTRKPVVYKPLREYCHEKYETFQRPGLEGDDVLGILATHPSLVKGEKVVVSIDKDMKTIPGLHCNYQKCRDDGLWGVLTVTEDEADYNHMTQTLTGDTTDGYPGCPGIGPVKAEKVLAAATVGRNLFSSSLAWPLIVAAYEKAGLNEEVALQNARVARILRADDYDFQAKEPVLWTPV